LNKLEENKKLQGRKNMKLKPQTEEKSKGGFKERRKIVLKMP
jgi:hypothetical protein